MIDLLKSLNDVDQSLRSTNDRAMFEAWFAGSSFVRCNTNTNISLLKGIFQGYSNFITDEIIKSSLTEDQKKFERQKLFVLTELINNVFTTFESQPGHGDNLYFLAFLSAYVNNAIRKNFTN